MKIKSILSTAILFTGLTLSSCTMMLLNEVEGGHSPMQQLDGTWNVEENIEIENGKETVKEDVGGVFLNATRDQYGFCEGEWLETDATVVTDFLWGIKANDNDEGETFMTQDKKGDEIEWEVKSRTLKVLEIERTENGVTTKMKLSK